MNRPASILVIAMRRLGDVLLATPLIHALHLTWPTAAIDAMVFEGTEIILHANPDIRQIIKIPERSTMTTQIGSLFSLIRRYDIAISTQSGDRPTFYAWLAGRYRVGMLEKEFNQFWKRLLLTRWTPFDNQNTHTVLMNMKMADLLEATHPSEIIVSWSVDDEKRVKEVLPFSLGEPFAVLHLYPKYRYKMWHREGWIELAQWLYKQGLRIVLTGGAEQEEITYVGEICREMYHETINLAGKLSLAETGFMLSRTKIYIGPDTVTTHISAALGVPTVALFGPTNPVKWGPWPKNYAGKDNPYKRTSSQRVENVFLLQGQGSCVPCHEEGCEGHAQSPSECLDELSSVHVIGAVCELLDIPCQESPACSAITSIEKENLKLLTT